MTTLASAVKATIEAHPDVVKAVRIGRSGVGYLVGRVILEHGTGWSPQEINAEVCRQLLMEGRDETEEAGRPGR